MTRVNIREELGKKVYDLILALADPNTGVARVKANDLLAMLNNGRYEERHVQTAIKYLVEDAKLKYVERNGNLGMTLKVPALLKCNTVTQKTEYHHPKDSLVELEKERFGLKKPETPAPPAPVETVEQLFKLRDRTALHRAERALRDNGELIGEVLTAFLQTYQALDDLVREVKNHGGDEGSKTTNTSGT